MGDLVYKTILWKSFICIVFIMRAIRYHFYFDSTHDVYDSMYK